KFKQPNKQILFETDLSYNTFSSIPGVEDPSGIYYDVKSSDVTGNESTRVIGQLLTNPLRPVTNEEEIPPKNYIFARTDIKLKGFKSEVGDDEYYYDEKNPNVTLYLFAVDAAKNDGKTGFQFALLLPD